MEDTRAIHQGSAAVSQRRRLIEVLDPSVFSREIQAPVSALMFWLAVSLPVIYIPLFFNGIDTVQGLALFLGLFGLHVTSLVGGHHYRRTEP